MFFEEGTRAVYCVPHATPHYQIVDLESFLFVFDFLKDRPSTLLTRLRKEQNYSESPAIRRQYCPARTATMSFVM